VTLAITATIGTIIFGSGSAAFVNWSLLVVVVFIVVVVLASGVSFAYIFVVGDTKTTPANTQSGFVICLSDS
jgi:hypothetical protein